MPSTRWISFALPFALALCGCSFDAWDSSGDWRSGAVTLPGQDPMSVRGTVSLGGGTRYDRVRLCSLRELQFGFGFSTVELGDVGAIQVHFARPVCRLGTTAVDGGTVLVYRHPSPRDSLALRAFPDPSWTVSGSVTITEYRDLGDPSLDVGESAVTETLAGTFSISATDTSGTQIRLGEGTFDLAITKSRYRRSLD